MIEYHDTVTTAGGKNLEKNIPIILSKRDLDSNETNFKNTLKI